MKNKRLILILLGAVLIVLGLAFYLLFNKNVFIVKAVSSFIVPDILPAADINDNPVIKIIRNFGADFLWSAAFTLTIQSILFLPKKRAWLLIFCGVLGLAYEFLQLLGITNGTADIIDVMIYFFGSAIGVLIILGGKFYEQN